MSKNTENLDDVSSILTKVELLKNNSLAKEIKQYKKYDENGALVEWGYVNPKDPELWTNASKKEIEAYNKSHVHKVPAHENSGIDDNYDYSLSSAEDEIERARALLASLKESYSADPADLEEDEDE